jgi:hypothetical protein
MSPPGDFATKKHPRQKGCAMDKNYAGICSGISANLKKLRKDAPQIMQAFSALAQAATSTAR